MALDGHGLVVDRAILVRCVAAEHGVDDAEPLVRQGHDGFLVPLADRQRRELILQGTATAGGGLGKLAEYRCQN